MGRAIGSMAAAFLVTIGCGLYFWHAGRQLADRQVPTEASKKDGSPNPQPNQEGARPRAEDLAEVGMVPPAPDSASSRGKSPDTQPAASPSADPKTSNAPAAEEQTRAATRLSTIDEAASQNASAPDRQVECERALRLHVKGLQMMEIGDMVAARPLFEKAADAGLCKSAWELARTYDPVAMSKLSAWRPMPRPLGSGIKRRANSVRRGSP
jgi:hypothetical protein